MPYNKIIKISLLFYFICICATAYSQQKTLDISGLKIYTKYELIRILKLDRYYRGKISSKEVIALIEKFYKKQGFSIVKIYIIESKKNSLSLYVDEGRLGKIIFLNLDDVGTLWIRYYNFKLWPVIQNKIFNAKILEEKLNVIKEKRGYADITYELKPVKNYDESIFQLDRDLLLPIIGTTNLPFINKYGYRYDLEIKIVKSAKIPNNLLDEKNSEIDIERLQKIEKESDAGKEDKKKKKTIHKFDIGIKLHYTLGFIPKVRYYHANLFSDGDGFKLGSDLGIMYGIDRKFGKPPRVTFFKIDTAYLFTPTLQELFTPYIRGFFYLSKAGRPDLGLLKYDYRLVNGMLAPGITFLKKWKIYTGIGEEIITHTNTRFLGNEKLYRIIQKQIRRNASYYYTYLESGIVFNIDPDLIGNPDKTSLSFVYDYYFGEKIFHKIMVHGHIDFEFKDRSVYTGKLDYKKIWHKPPFYHEASVTSQEFKGFMGRGFYSRNILSISNEYKISIYKDYIYAGLYNDYTLFEGSGYDLPVRRQFGIVGGPTVRYVFMDQFEFYLYYGWDILFPNHRIMGKNRIHGNFTFNLYKKW